MNRISYIRAKNHYLSQAKLIFNQNVRTEANVQQSKVANLSSNDAGAKTDVTEDIQTTIPKSLKINQYMSPTLTQEKGSSFNDIPGPVSLRLISQFWRVVPTLETQLVHNVAQYLLSGGKFFGGLLSWGGNAPFFQKFFKVYGPVVRLHGAFGSDVVLLCRPEHASIIFQNEGQYPIRSCLGSIEKYLTENKKYKNAGPFSIYGQDWEKLRKSVEVPLQTIIEKQYGQIEDICEEFVSRILCIRNKQEEMPNYFRLEILKWSLECLCSLLLNTKLGFLDPQGVSPYSDAGKVLEGLNGAIEAISKCEYGFQLWKFFETPSYKSLVKNCDAMGDVIIRHIVSTLKDLEKQTDHVDNGLFLERLILKEKIQEDDLITLILDMFLIGANAVTHTVAFLFYHLAKNPRTQIKLYEDIKKYNGKITREEIKNIPYLHACIKEVLRLNPAIPILSRVLNKDMIIHHYSIPSGTYVLFASHLNGISEEYFDDALKFKPDRWINNELGGFGNDYQTFASLPFGYGAKSCFAKEMAETQIALLLFKVCSKFKIEYNYGAIQSSNEMFASPKKPLKFRFIDRIVKV